MNLSRIRLLLSSKLVTNGAWLYFLQIFNTIIPLVTLPYITRILGSSQYGVFAFSLNLIGYFQVMVEYGFDLVGARKVATAKDKNEVQSIYSIILTCKILFCIGAFIILLFVSLIVGVDKLQFYSLLILFSLVLGSALQQTWLFQGLQEMKYITIINVIARSMSVIAIFLFVKEANQIYLYCILYAMTFLLSGLFSFIIISKHLGITYQKPSNGSIIKEVKEGWYIFTTNAMSKIFSGFGVTILGITSTENYVGIYSAIQKIPMLMIMLYAPIGQVIYPYVSKYYMKSIKSGMHIVKKIGFIVFPIFVAMGVTLIVISKYIVGLLFGSEYSAYSTLLIPLICWVLLSILNNFLGMQTLVASSHQKEYSIAFRIGFVALIAVNILLGAVWKLYGVAIAAMVSELALTLSLLYQIKKIKRKTNMS